MVMATATDMVMATATVTDMGMAIIRNRPAIPVLGLMENNGKEMACLLYEEQTRDEGIHLPST